MTLNIHDPQQAMCTCVFVKLVLNSEQGIRFPLFSLFVSFSPYCSLVSYSISLILYLTLSVIIYIITHLQGGMLSRPGSLSTLRETGSVEGHTGQCNPMET